LSENFYTILTAVGKNKLANSAALGSKVNFKTLKVGDGNGTYYEPLENQTSLVNKVWEGNISSISIDENNSNWIVIQTIIPATDGGFFIREAGIFDEAGDLIAVSKISETYKPVISEGSTKNVSIKIVLEVSNASSVTLKIDPTVIIATKADIQILESKVNSLDSDFNAHIVDSRYEAAGGTATALTVSIQTLVNGYAKTFVASANNGAALTTLNGRKLYKPGTTTSPNLILGKAYTVWYNAPGDCFFIKASAEGSALAKDVRKNTTFSNDNDTGVSGGLDLSLLVSGNLRAGITVDGVTGKSSVVDTADALATATQILSGVTAYVNGSKITGNIPNNYGVWQISGTPVVGTGRLHMFPPKGYYDPSGSTGVYYDSSDYLAANIVKDKNIFGLVGSATINSLGGRQYATGATAAWNINYAGSSTNKYGIVLSLPFTAKMAFAYDSYGNTITYLHKIVTGLPLNLCIRMPFKNTSSYAWFGDGTEREFLYSTTLDPYFYTIAANNTLVTGTGTFTWFAWE